DRQYRICWGLKSIDGQNASLTGVVIRQADTAPDKYVIEMKFPWETLGYIAPAHGVRFGFDMVISDNDGHLREGMIGWNVANESAFQSTKEYGDLELRQTADGLRSLKGCAYSIFTGSQVNSDGTIEDLWELAPQYTVSKQILPHEAKGD